LFGGAFTLERRSLDEIAMSSPTSVKTQDEAIDVVDKFGVTLGGDPKCCPVDKWVYSRRKKL